MGRTVKLTPDQVHRLRLNVEKYSLKQWAQEFGVSTVTIVAARKGHRLGYAFGPTGHH
jgi:hypothetical protein